VLWRKKARRGSCFALGATLALRQEIGLRTTGPSFPQIRLDTAAFLATGLYLCSRSSRGCGNVEKRAFPSSLPKFLSTGHVENLWTTEGVLWMKKSCPQRVHSWNPVLHRLSPI